MGQGDTIRQRNMTAACPGYGTHEMCRMCENHGGNNLTCYMYESNGNTSPNQNRLNCASLWLEKAIELHDLHMRDPKVAANESSQLELMEQMQKAYACLMENNTTYNMTNGMMNKTNNDSAGYYQHSYLCYSEAKLECASFWLKKAIEMHELHLTDPKAAANESSQMEMMNQMMRAYACIHGNNMNMDQNINLTQARFDCAAFWLKKAIELHDLHLTDPKEAANESSQIEMMDQMMKAYECLTGKNLSGNMTMDGMTNTTTAHASGGH
jgi:tetratricopeptide (TPR) repeat protein